jgi:hypothetical protein
LVSRHSQPSDETEYTKESRAKAVKAAEEAKRQKMLEREARNKALLAIEEDRIRNKQRKLAHQTSRSEENNIGTSSSTASQPETSSKPSQNTALIQIRLSTGQAIRQKFSSSTKISNLFEWVSNEKEPSKNFQLMLPFPRKVFGDDQMDTTLEDAGLVPNASLNVVKLDISPQQPQQPAVKSRTSNTSNRRLDIESDDDEDDDDEDDDDDDDDDDDGSNQRPVIGNPQVPPQIPAQPVIPTNIPSNVPSQVPPQIPAQPMIPNNIPPNVPPHFLPQVPPLVPPQIPNNIPPNFPPNFGRPPRIQALRGRFPPNVLMGMRPPPFSGGGHRLTDNPILPQDSDDQNGEHGS